MPLDFDWWTAQSSNWMLEVAAAAHSVKNLIRTTLDSAGSAEADPAECTSGKNVPSIRNEEDSPEATGWWAADKVALDAIRADADGLKDSPNAGPDNPPLRKDSPGSSLKFK